MALSRAASTFALLAHGAGARSLTHARLRVMTYNVHAWRDSGHADNFDRVVDVCAAEDADVLCLNEVLHPYNIEAQTDGYLAAVKDGAGVGLDVRPCAVADSYLHRLAAALGMPHVAFVEAERAKCFFGAAPFGNAVLSRRPFVDAGHLVLAPDPGDVRLGGQRRDDGRSSTFKHGLSLVCQL